MKRTNLVFIFLITVVLVLSSCGSNKNSSMEEEGLNNPYVTEDDILATEKDSQNIPIESYIGEYNDTSVNNPMLEIQKNEDGTLKIEIGIYRLTELDDCVGIVKKNKVVFTTDEIFDDELKGEITLEGDVATVRLFGDEWLDFAGFNYCTYNKTSDIPYDHYDEY